MKTLKRLTAWLDEDFNRAVEIMPTHTAYQCRLQYMRNGKREYASAWFGDTVEEAINEALSCKEWEDA